VHRALVEQLPTDIVELDLLGAPTSASSTPAASRQSVPDIAVFFFEGDQTTN